MPIPPGIRFVYPMSLILSDVPNGVCQASLPIASSSGAPAGRNDRERAGEAPKR